MFPLTLGANIGTTVTALIASLVQEGTDPLQVALAHLFFNITGTLIWYPAPFMRKIPLNGARLLGKATRIWRGFPILYIAVLFFIIPTLFLGLSSLFEQHTKGWTVLGCFVTILVGLALFYTGYWCRFKDGQEKVATCFANRQRKRETLQNLPDDMEYLKSQILALKEHTGLGEDDAEAQNNDEAVNKEDDDKGSEGSTVVEQEIET
jgi:sodium-dependent phosphate cotransporter